MLENIIHTEKPSHNAIHVIVCAYCGCTYVYLFYSHHAYVCTMLCIHSYIIMYIHTKTVFTPDLFTFICLATLYLY